MSGSIHAEPQDSEAEIKRLQAICVSAHDRLLRGDDDNELLALLATAWEKPQDGGEKGQGHV